MGQKNKKLLITTKENVLNSLSKEPDLFKVFDGCTWEVYKYLLNYRYANLYDKLFCDEKTLENYLKDLKTFDKLANDNVPVFEDSSVDCCFADNKTFIGWLGEKDNKDVFLKNVLGMNTPFLVKKRENAELYVAPVLNDNYNDNNVCYIEELINVIKGSEEDDLYLLLHDKDLYKNVDGGIKHRKVTVNDASISDKVNSKQKLKEMINKERVFVFTHQDSDNYYTQIIQKIITITIDRVVQALTDELFLNNLVLFEKLGNCMSKSEMEQAYNSFNNNCDFSKPFMP